MRQRTIAERFTPEEIAKDSAVRNGVTVIPGDCIVDSEALIVTQVEEAFGVPVRVPRLIHTIGGSVRL